MFIDKVALRAILRLPPLFAEGSTKLEPAVNTGIRNCGEVCHNPDQ
jgi:hypothetical protein